MNVSYPEIKPDSPPLATHQKDLTPNNTFLGEMSGSSSDVSMDSNSPSSTLLLTPFHDTRDAPKRLIGDAVAEVFNIHTIHEWQVEAIFHVLHKQDLFTIINGHTAGGKTLILLTVALIRPKVSLVLVPLLGLGSDQVEKATVHKHNVKAYHVDEHRGVGRFKS